ncbi:hypothetical protein ACJMK2_000538 [Sinanodonta woodiana]|uniref:Sodium/potassium-transporting ATPase subunit beta-1-interacting protein n=1 Tax=Sinanodonta woodiana TaxID=1069815 RepID=A0ABD3XT22_SINWO
MFATKETFWKRIFLLTMNCSKSQCASTALHTVIIVILCLQLLSTVERQVFDFLGYMWAPIIGNFFQIICVILGIFGTCQYRTRFIAVYTTWTLMWLGWNIFVICLYLEVGVLNRNREIYILNIGTRNKSWWLTHGIGCKVNDTWLRTEASQTISGRQIPPEEYVEGCILDYYYVEVIHASIQCLLSLIGFVFTCMAIYMFSEEDESCKYMLTYVSTYTRPHEHPSIHYQPVSTTVAKYRNSWSLPTYVSYTDSTGSSDLAPSISTTSTTQTVVSITDNCCSNSKSEHLMIGNQSDSEMIQLI